MYATVSQDNISVRVKRETADDDVVLVRNRLVEPARDFPRELDLGSQVCGLQRFQRFLKDESPLLEAA